MKVEDYTQEEVREEAGSPECTSEAMQLIEKMGLEGQKTLFVKNDDGEETARIPFRKMTKSEKNLWETLCPDVRKLEDFSNSPIPIRALQIIAYAKDLGVFDEVIILDKVAADFKDPVAVGIVGTRYSGDRYMICRWGDELDEMPALIKRAAGIKREKLISDAHGIISDCKRFLERISQISDASIVDTDSPHAYGFGN